jgi:hypothetical protein
MIKTTDEINSIVTNKLNVENSQIRYRFFDGTDSAIVADFPYFRFSQDLDFIIYLQNLSREAENVLRQKNGAPKIGEGWISETSLYHAIKKSFPETIVVHHGMPKWLKPQHLDIWLPQWEIAIEYHGEQHFKPIKIFGGKEGFEKTKRRDELKATLCKKNKITLIIVKDATSLEQIINEIQIARKISVS